MQLDDVPDDAGAEAETAVLARRAAVDPPEALEQMRRSLRLEADPGIANREAQLVIGRREPDLDVPAGGRELDRIRHEIPDDRLEAIRRDGDRAGRALDRH